MTESYWQIGFNDGYAGSAPQWPTPDGPHEFRNSGYSNGYDEGRRKRRSEQAPERYAALVAKMQSATAALSEPQEGT